MPVIRQIAQLGNPVLRDTAAVVATCDDRIRILADDMLATAAYANGVGLAAPQVFEPLRMLLMASRPNPRYPSAPDLPPALLINPELLWSSDDREYGWEGCLSIPAMRGLVSRHRKVGVRFLSLAGEVQEVEYEGFPARIFQHEYDHLNGLLYVDRLESMHDLVTEMEFLRHHAK